jgi:hypothetical protein
MDLYIHSPICRTYWKCVNKEECIGTIITRDSPWEVISASENSHAPIQGRVTSIGVFKHMKRQTVGDSEMTPSVIIGNRCQSLSSCVLLSSINSCYKVSTE